MFYDIESYHMIVQFKSSLMFFDVFYNFFHKSLVYFFVDLACVFIAPARTLRELLS